MSKGDSNNPILLGLILFILFGCFSYLAWEHLAPNAPKHVHNDYESSKYAVSAQARLDAICGEEVGVRLAECTVKIEQSERDNHRAQKDLRAQRYMAAWAFVMAVSAIATVGITTVGLRWIKGTLDQTREAVRAADAAVSVTRDVGRDQSRAYVSVDKVQFFWGGKSMSNPQCRVTVLNSGQTPAKWYQARTVAFAPTIDSFPEEFPAESLPADFGRKWNAISSGAKLNFPCLLTDQADEVKLAHNDGVSTPKNGFVIFGEIRYLTFFGEIFTSQFVFGAPAGLRRYELLKRKTEKRGILTIHDDVERPVPLSRLSYDLETYKREADD